MVAIVTINLAVKWVPVNKDNNYIVCGTVVLAVKGKCGTN